METVEWEWVQCDKCQKWRGLKPEDFSRAVQEETWYCFQNPDTAQASCDIPQILTDSEIDAIYKKRVGNNDVLEMGKACCGQETAKARKLMHPVIWQGIHGNVYTYKRRKSWKEDDIAICQCRLISGKGCLDNCINRMLNIECTNGFCPCGAACTNQRFSCRQHASVEIRRAGLKGFGLFCTERISEGGFVTEYMGEIVDETEYLRRRTFYAENAHKHYYFMQIGNGEVIDACRMGNAGRFMNHSCDPNCETQKWVVKGDLRVGFFALRDIEAGEELTFNYNFQTEKPIRCCCGSSKCNGTIGGQKILTGVEQTEEMNNETTSRETIEIPDPIMLKEHEVDEVMRGILARQVGLEDEYMCSLEQIRARLRDLYLKHGLHQLADSLEAESITDSGTRMVPTRETSSGESSERPTSSRDGTGRGSSRKRGRARSRALVTGGLVDRRGGRLGWVRPKTDPERRRSEVDSSLDDITAASGKLYNPSRKNILNVLRLFNLIEIGMNEKERHEAELAREKEQKIREELERSGQIYLGTAGRSQPRQQPISVAGYCVNEISTDDAPPTARQRAQFADLSLLLDVVQHTIDPAARNLFIECGILSQLQQVIGRNFAPQYSVMLRKILRVVDCLPLRKSDFEKTRSSHGTMGNLITALTHHKDNGVRSIANSIARQYNLESEQTQKQRQEQQPRQSQPSLQTETRQSNQGSADAHLFRCGSAPTGREIQDEFRGTRSTAFSRGPYGPHSVPPPYGHEFVNGPLYPPPPPPPPTTPHEKARDEMISTRAESGSSASLSLPPGFGCFRSHPSRGREFESCPRRSHRTAFHDFKDIPRHESAPDRFDLKRKTDVQQRIVRKLPRTATAPDSLFSKELGKLQHISETSHEELLAKEARDLEEERQRLSADDDTAVAELEGWDHLNRDFEDFVRQTLRQRIQKYQQPEHPLRLSATEAENLYKKLYASIIESEENAFRTFAKDQIRRHVSKVKLALNIKEFTSKSMHNYYDSARSHIKAEHSNNNSS